MAAAAAEQQHATQAEGDVAAAGGISRLRKPSSQQGQCIEPVAGQQPPAAAAHAAAAPLQQQIKALEQQMVIVRVRRDKSLAEVAGHGQAGELHHNALRQ